jgi:hypothetical protein
MNDRDYLIKFLFLILWISYIASSCNYSNKEDESRKNRDSTELRNLLISLYKWHTPGNDFDVITQDSFQIGLDTSKLNSTLKELKETDFFTDEFLNTYRKIGEKIDFKLRHDTIKYCDEINFVFQDADPYTFFQDDVSSWDSLKITDLSIANDTSSLQWILLNGPYATDKYKVKFKRENNKWKISYLQGFDISLYY